MNPYFILLVLCIKLATSSVCEVGTNNGLQITANTNAGQTFVSPITGNLRTVTLYSLSSSITASVELFSGQVLSTGSSAIASSNGSISQNTFEAEFTYAPVVAGSEYTVLVTPSAPLILGQGSYSNGTGILDGASVQYDLAFSLCFSAMEFTDGFAYNATDGDIYIELAAMDSMGNTIAIGEIYGNISLGGQVYEEPAAGYVAKYDNSSDRNLIWSRILPVGDAYLYAVSVGDDGAVAIGGAFFTFIQFPDSTNCTASAGLFVVYYSADGTPLWHKCYLSVTNNACNLNSILISNGAVFAPFSFYGNISFEGQTYGYDPSGASLILAKYDLTGQLLRSQYYEPGGVVQSISATSDNSILISTVQSKNFTMNGTAIIIDSDQSLVVKLSATDYSLIWYQHFPDCILYSMDVDTEQGIVVGGRDFSHGDTMYVAKMDPSGSVLWEIRSDDQNTQVTVVKVGYHNNIFATEIISDGESLITYTSDGVYLEEKNCTGGYCYSYGLATRPSTKTVAWGNTFNYNTTADGFEYNATNYGSFFHWFEGIYVEDIPDINPSPSPTLSPSTSPSSDDGSSTARLEVFGVLMAVAILIVL